MENKFVDYDFHLSTDGAGIVLYSENAITCDEGEDFFSKEFSTPFKVAEHLAKGDIIGFNTGSSGDFVIKIRYGYPSEKMLAEYPICSFQKGIAGNKAGIVDAISKNSNVLLAKNEKKLKAANRNDRIRLSNESENI